MQYFELTYRKLLFITALALILASLVYLALGALHSHFGALPFTDVTRLIVAKGYHSVRYALEVRRISDNQSASAHAALLENGQAARAVPVLIYHSIVHESESENFTRASFETQMFALKRAGWETVSLEEFVAFMRGERSVPEHSFLLTFDDGARNSYHPVDPLLEALNYEAVNFVLPKHSLPGTSHYYLSKAELERMQASGRWTIQSHGQDSHVYLPIDAEGTLAPALANRVWLTDAGRIETPTEYALRVERDLRTARLELEEAFQKPVYAFAFPFGEFGHLSENHPAAADVVTIIAQRVYDATFYQWWPGEGYRYNYPGHGTPGMYKRIEPRVSWTGMELAAALEQGFPKDLPYNALLTQTDGWMLDWGRVSYDEGMTLTPRPHQTGATVVLDGSGDWRNYVVQATVRSPNNTGFALFVRYADTNNHALCNFGENFTHVEQVVDGTRRVIKGVREPSLLPRGSITAQVRVTGRTVSCSLNDKPAVTTEFLDPSLEVGGIAVKTWSPTPEESSLTVDELRVEPLP